MVFPYKPDFDSIRRRKTAADRIVSLQFGNPSFCLQSRGRRARKGNGDANSGSDVNYYTDALLLMFNTQEDAVPVAEIRGGKQSPHIVHGPSTEPCLAGVEIEHDNACKSFQKGMKAKRTNCEQGSILLTHKPGIALNDPRRARP